MSVAPGGALSAARITVAVDAPSGWRPARWVVPLFGLAALLLVPWVVLLVFALPSTQRAAHWDIAWAGFDVALALLLFTVALAAWRRSPWLEGAATAAATLLFMDAWFDVLTSSTRTEFWVSILEAAFVELPLAILCLLLARAAERRVAFGGRQTSAAPRTPELPVRRYSRTHVTPGQWMEGDRADAHVALRHSCSSPPAAPQRSLPPPLRRPSGGLATTCNEVDDGAK